MPYVIRSIFRSLFIVAVAGIVLAQDGEFYPGNKLIVDGIPKIPISLARTVANYRNNLADSLLGWDPVKPEIMIMRRRPEAWMISRVIAPLELPQPFAYPPTGYYETAYQPQGHSLVFRVDDTGGSEITQLYCYDIKAGFQVLLTDGKSRNLYPMWSNSGDRVIYSSTRRNGKDLDIYVVNPVDEKTDHLVAELRGEDWAAFDWSPDDRRVIISDFRSTNESYLWILDVATGQKTLLTPIPPKGVRVFNGSYAQFSKDGKGVYHLTDRDSEFQRLAYVDIATGRYRYLTGHIKWDVEEFILSPSRGLLAFTTNENGFGILHMLDTATGKELRVPKIPTGVLSGLKWHNNGNFLGFVLSSSASPGDVYSIDVKAARLQRWTSSYAGVMKSTPPEPEPIRWKAADGTTIPGFLYMPPARFTGRRPVLIDIHGGPSLQYRPGFRGRDDYFTFELGIAMIYPNIRGSAGYGKTYLTLDNGLLRGDSYRDIGALLDWIKTRSDLDSERVMLRGASWGGNVALAGAGNLSGRIRGAIAVSAPSDIVTYLEAGDSWMQDRSREEYGDEREPGMRQYLERIAPSNNAKGMKGPLLIIHGKRDSRVPVSESEQMIAAAKQEGLLVWSLLLNDEGHGFAEPRTKEFSFLSEVMFVQRYLLGP